MNLRHNLRLLFPASVSGAFFLTLKASITTAADDNYNQFSLFSEKIRLDMSCESSAYLLQMIKLHKFCAGCAGSA